MPIWPPARRTGRKLTPPTRSTSPPGRSTTRDWPCWTRSTPASTPTTSPRRRAPSPPLSRTPGVGSHRPRAPTPPHPHATTTKERPYGTELRHRPGVPFLRGTRRHEDAVRPDDGAGRGDRRPVHLGRLPGPQPVRR